MCVRARGVSSQMTVSAARAQRECDTSATRVRHERRECNVRRERDAAPAGSGNTVVVRVLLRRRVMRRRAAGRLCVDVLRLSGGLEQTA